MAEDLEVTSRANEADEYLQGLDTDVVADLFIASAVETFGMLPQAAMIHAALFVDIVLQHKAGAFAEAVEATATDEEPIVAGEIPAVDLPDYDAYVEDCGL